MRKGVVTNVQLEREALGVSFKAAKKKLKGVDLAKIERYGTDSMFKAQRISKVTGVCFAAYLWPRIVDAETETDNGSAKA